MLKLLFAFTLLSISLHADWSAPVQVSRGPTSINFSPGARPLSIDSNSVALVGWLDGSIGTSQTLSSSMLIPQATVWTPPQLIFTNTTPNYFPVFPTMSQDISGGSTAVFGVINLADFNTIINASRRVAGMNNWPAPIPLDLGGFVVGGSQAFDKLGNMAALLAVTDTGSSFRITFIQMPALTTAWLKPIVFATDTAGQPALAAKSYNGLSTLAWKVSTPTLQIQTVRFNLLTQQASSTILAPIPAGATDILALDIAVDAGGDAILLILAQTGAGNALYSSTLRFGSQSWSQPLLISNPSNLVVGASIAADTFGTSTIFWGEQVAVGQQFARAATLPLGGTPIFVTNLTQSLPGTTVDATSRVKMDSFGNAVAIWVLSTGGQNLIQTSAKPAGKKWTGPITLYNNGSTPGIALSDQGTAVAVWRDFVTTILYASRNLTLFPVAPPTNFVAEARQNRFLNKTENVLAFRWNPSLAPNIVSYQIKRNGVTVATIGPGGPFEFFTNAVDGTFTLVAKASNGNQSVPLRPTFSQ